MQTIKRTPVLPEYGEGRRNQTAGRLLYARSELKEAAHKNRLLDGSTRLNDLVQIQIASTAPSLSSVRCQRCWDNRQYL